MRAVAVREHGPFRSPRLETVPDPVPGRGEVVIDARAIGVNYPDLLVIEGKYQFLPPRPFSPGKEVAGVVSAVGPGVTRFKPGDRVMAQREYGTYAEKTLSPEATCYRMPDALGFEQGAALGLAGKERSGLLEVPEAANARGLREAGCLPDAGPGLYVVQQRFATPDGARHTRTGVIAAVTAEPFGGGRVRPHERTHAGPKQDRLELLRTTGQLARVFQ